MSTIRLQSVGHVNAKQAGQLKAGDVTIWNFGSKATIISQHSETRAMITFNMIDENQNEYKRRFKKTRYVGIV